MATNSQPVPAGHLFVLLKWAFRCSAGGPEVETEVARGVLRTRDRGPKKKKKSHDSKSKRKGADSSRDVARPTKEEEKNPMTSAYQRTLEWNSRKVKKLRQKSTNRSERHMTYLEMSWVFQGP